MMYLRAVQGMVVVAFAAVCFPPVIQCQQELPRTTEPAGVVGKEKPRKELNSALRDAATSGHTEYVKALLAQGADVNADLGWGTTALMHAAGRGHLDTVKALLVAGADVNSRDTRRGRTALLVAATQGHAEIVRALLAHGADVNAKDYRDWTPLMEAARYGRTETVRVLLLHSADVNARSHRDWTPLMLAPLGNKDTAIVEVLLAGGADVNAKNYHGWTPLMAAAENNRTAIVETLLAHGADLNAQQKHGRTSLMTVSEKGHIETVKMLLAKGAEVNTKSEDGMTALALASNEGHKETIKTLLDSGAEPLKPHEQAASDVSIFRKELQAIRGSGAGLEEMIPKMETFLARHRASALSIYPAATAYSQVAELCLQAGKYQKAIEYAEKAHLFQELFTAPLVQGSAAMMALAHAEGNGPLEEAERIARKLLLTRARAKEVLPESIVTLAEPAGRKIEAEAHLVLGLVAWKREQLHEAEERMRTAHEAGGTVTPFPAFKLGQFLLKQGNTSEGFRLLAAASVWTGHDKPIPGGWPQQARQELESAYRHQQGSLDGLDALLTEAERRFKEKAEAHRVAGAALMNEFGIAGRHQETRYKVNDKAPDFQGTDADGGRIQLTDYRGQVVLLDFWATWCAPCIAELPNVVEVYKTYHHRGLEIISISLDRSTSDFHKFRKSHPEMSWPQILVGEGFHGMLAELYGVQSLPTTYLLDRTGTVRAVNVHGEELRKAVGKLLPKAPAADLTGVLKPEPEHRPLVWSIWGLPIDAGQGQITGELTPVIQDASNSIFPTVSSDGRMLAFISDRAGNNDIWIKDLATGNESALIESAADEHRAIISPDGSKVAYARRGRRNIYVRDLPRGEERKVCEGCSLLGWSPDGREIVAASGRPIGFDRIDVATGETGVLVRHPRRPLHLARFSPDGQWLAFKIVFGNKLPSLFITPVSDSAAAQEDEWIQITEGHFDSRAWWSPDGNLLYFLSWRDEFLCIWARRLDASTKQPLGPAFAVHHVHGSDGLLRSQTFGYGMTADTLYFARR